jgi:hypothetical protein
MCCHCKETTENCAPEEAIPGLSITQYSVAVAKGPSPVDDQTIEFKFIWDPFAKKHGTSICEIEWSVHHQNSNHIQ